MKIYEECTLKKAILVRITLRRRSFLPFSQKIKKKQKYEKEGKDIHIVRISTTFGFEHVNFLIFPDIITQSTEMKFLSKRLIEGPLILLLTETETSTEHKCAISNLKMVV